MGLTLPTTSSSGATRKIERAPALLAGGGRRLDGGSLIDPAAGGGAPGDLVEDEACTNPSLPIDEDCVTVERLVDFREAISTGATEVSSTSVSR